MNIFWSPTIQAWVQDYIQEVFDPRHGLAFGNRIWAVRIGVHYGELLYPSRATDGGPPGPNGTMSLWAYDATAQANCRMTAWPA